MLVGRPPNRECGPFGSPMLPPSCHRHPDRPRTDPWRGRPRTMQATMCAASGDRLQIITRDDDRMIRRQAAYRHTGPVGSPHQKIRRVIRGALAMTHTLRRLAEGMAGHGGVLAMRLQQRSLWRLLAAVPCSSVLAAAFRAVRAISFRIVLRTRASSDASRSALAFAENATAISCSS
jgi:hypothetical protein